MSDEVIGTHFIDLSAISNDGANGKLSLICYLFNITKCHAYFVFSVQYCTGKVLDAFLLVFSGMHAQNEIWNTRNEIVTHEKQKCMHERHLKHILCSTVLTV